MAVYFCLKVYDTFIFALFNLPDKCATMNVRNTVDVYQRKGVVWQSVNPTVKEVFTSYPAEAGRSKLWMDTNRMEQENLSHSQPPN